MPWVSARYRLLFVLVVHEEAAQATETEPLLFGGAQERYDCALFSLLFQHACDR